MSTFLWDCDCFEVPGNPNVRLHSPDVVEMGLSDAPTRLSVAGLGRSPWVELCATDRWVCIIGVDSPEVVIARPEDDFLEVVAQIDRLDFGDGYDPGGMQRVRFHQLDGDSLLVEYEFGIAMIHVFDGLQWNWSHNDVSCRVISLDETLIRVESDLQRMSIRLSDGEQHI